jgi:hypothetical protein
MHSKYIVVVSFVVKLYVTVNYVEILIVVLQCFYGIFMSLATMQIIRTRFERNYISNNLHILTHYIQKLY